MALQETGVRLVAQNKGGFVSDMRESAGAVTGFADQAEKSRSRLGSFGSSVASSLSTVGKAALTGFAVAGAATTGFVASAVGSAATYESTLNRFASVTGSSLAASGKSLNTFSDLFLDMGARTKYSAQEAALAAVELAKGGIDPLTIASGALEATLSLAAAGEIELAAAAEISAKQLGVWADTGVGAVMVADLLAQAANASTVDIDELAGGMANVSGVAKAMGVAYKDTVTTMALIAPAFSSSQEAGTSLRNFFTRLIPTTTAATDAMRSLGLITADGTNTFFDATGSFIGMEGAAGLLQGAFSGLTDQQKTTALQTIFGTDAFTAANAIVEAGTPGYQAMGAAMAAQGTAAEQAAAKNKGYAAAMEGFTGSVDTLKIVLGTELLPLLTSLLGKMTEGANGALTFARGILSAERPTSALVASVNSAVPGFSSFVAGLSSAWGAAQPLVSIIQGNLVPILATLAALIGGSVVVAVASMIVSFLSAAAPVLALIAVGAALYAGWSTNFLGIRTIITGTVIPAILQFSQMAQAGFNAVLPTLAIIGTQVLALGGKFQQFVANLLPAWESIKAAWVSAGPVWVGVVAVIMGALSGLIGFIGGALPGVGIAISGLVQIISGASQIITSVVSGLVSIVAGLLTGNWTAAWNGAKALVSGAVQGIISVVSGLVGIIFGIVGGLVAGVIGFFTNLYNVVVGHSIVPDMVNGIISWIGRLPGAVIGFISSLVSQAVAQFNQWRGQAQAAVQGLGSAVTSAVSSLASGVTSRVASLVSQAVGQFNNWRGQAVSAATSLASGVIGQVTSLQSRAIALVVSLAAQFIAKFNELRARSISAMSSLASTIAGMAGQFIAAAVGIGSGIIGGIVNGVQAGVGALVGAVQGAAQSALSAAKGLLGINSPSRVMRIEVGRPITEGMAQGVNDRRRELTRTMAALSTLTVQQAVGIVPSARDAAVTPPASAQQIVRNVAYNSTTTNQYNLNAQFGYQEPARVSDALRLFTLLNGA